MSLSGEQRAAVERAGQNVCVVAGPGSGKTRVLVERFAWLVEQCGIDPGRILAITFTEKAASEMKQRLVKRFTHRTDLRRAMESAWVSTIDAFCARLLRENAIAASLPPDFTVLEQAQAERMQRDAAEEALDALFAERPAEIRRLLEALDLSTEDGARQPDLAGSLLETYETMRVSGVRHLPSPRPLTDVLPRARQLAEAIRSDAMLDSLHDWAEDFLALPGSPVERTHFAVLARFTVNLTQLPSKKSPGYPAAREFKKEMQAKIQAQWIQTWNTGLLELLRTAISRIDMAYREQKRKQAVVDFADLEERSIALLESNTALCNRVSGQFDEVLMDELQDTNRLQWRLVNLIRRRLFAVGDANQSIYGFRHADRAVFDEYRQDLRDAGNKIDQLDENYRSRPEILDAVSRVLDGRAGIEHRPLTAKRQFTPVDGPVVERFVGAGDHGGDVEAGMVAARISEWVHSGARRYRDFAVLVRTLTSTPPFEKAFDRSNIPFLITGGRSFLETREVRDLMALLAALVNPLDEIALLCVLRSPLAGWNDERILREGRPGWQSEFERLFGRLRKLSGLIPPDRLLAMALDECGYLATLMDRGRANIEKLLAWIRREHRNRPRPLAELLEDLEALRATQTEAEAPPAEAADAVRIMSIHAAKGLEFPVVFVSALHRGPERRTPVILLSGDLGLGAKWRNPVTGKSAPDSVHIALAEGRKQEEEAEENRLLYVAMTRAEDRLIFSSAQTRRSPRWQALVEAALPEAIVAEQPLDPRGPSPHPAVPAAADVIIEPPKSWGQYDSSASVTSVALFSACPRKYYLARYLGLTPEPEAAGTGAIELGLKVHGALAGEVIDSAEALELAQRFKASDLGQRSERAARCEREFDFLLTLEDVVLRGQIDLWFEESGELVLVDYKTDRDESMASEYALQLRLYALALELHAGRLPDRAVLCYLRSGVMRDVSLTSEDLHAARLSVRALLAAQDSLEFPMKVGEQCHRCTFFGGICPAKLEG